jgi:hypothetical protein
MITVDVFAGTQCVILRCDSESSVQSRNCVNSTVVIKGSASSNLLPSGLNPITIATRCMTEQKVFINRLQAELLCILGLIPSRDKKYSFFHSFQISSNGYQDFFPSG